MATPSPERRSGSLVVVSNRLPYNIPKESSSKPPKRNVGGLVNALEPVLARQGGIWIGWDGIALASAGAVSSAAVRPRTYTTDSGIELCGVPLSEREIARYYHGFSNRALWPLFHDFLPTAVFQPDDFAAYVRVNRRFAETVLARLRPGDRLWVHDYHLMLVPLFLRRMGFKGRMDFFLHIPFPSPVIFRALPWREEILKGLLAADSVGFHVSGYVENFARVAEQVVGARIVAADDDGCVVLEHANGRTVAGAVPIGIDVDDFESLSRRADVLAKTEKILQVHPGQKIILGADRLDYTKGILQRFLTIERYLSNHPRAAGTFVMLQFVVPSRHQVQEYRELKREIDEEVGRINSQFGLEGWAPIQYRFRALDRPELVAYYRAASAALITPLRDGMNLVAAEFVASRTDEDGVLLLSEFAGIADLLPESVQLNPYDLEGCARSVRLALEMPLEERRERMRRLRRRVRANPVGSWAERCLGLGDRPPEILLQRAAESPRPFVPRPSPTT